MKLGIFDSGLGGLLVAKSIHETMPDIDIVYFGDTMNLPYGNKSSETIYELSKRGVEFLFEQDCALIVIACNTISASALRRLQQEYLPNSQYADRRILGVVVPTLEYAIDEDCARLGVIGTNYTIKSNIYKDELQKLNPDMQIFQLNTPLLVPLIENEGMKWLPSVLEDYLEPLITQNIECLILGCTHYPFLRNMIQEIIGDNIKIIGQDKIIPEKLKNYLERHLEIAEKITESGHIDFLVSDITDGYRSAAQKIYKDNIAIEHVSFTQSTYKRAS